MKFLDRKSLFWSVGPSMSWPIFDAGAIRRNIGVQSALQGQALVAYEKAVLSAFEEVIRRRKVEGVRSGTQLTVGDLATRGVIFVTPDQTIGEAVERMMKGRFTQLPVIVGERIVGGLTDDAIRDYTIEQTKTRKKTYEEVMRTRIEEIMDAPFPILNEDTPIDLASFHLQREEAILVSRKGAIVGILTSADFLNLGLDQ